MENIRIRDKGWNKVGSGISIPDPQHCFKHFWGVGVAKDEKNYHYEKRIDSLNRIRIRNGLAP
jgi:hypothetical protein